MAWVRPQYQIHKKLKQSKHVIVSLIILTKRYSLKRFYLNLEMISLLLGLSNHEVVMLH